MKQKVILPFVEKIAQVRNPRRSFEAVSQEGKLCLTYAPSGQLPPLGVVQNPIPMSKAHTTTPQVNEVDFTANLLDSVEETLGKAKELTERAVLDPSGQHFRAAKSYITRLTKSVEDLRDGVSVLEAVWKTAQEEPKAPEPDLDAAKLQRLTKAQLVELLLAEEPEAPKPKPKSSAKPKRRKKRRNTLAAKAAKPRSSNQRLEDSPFFEGVSQSWFRR